MKKSTLQGMSLREIASEISQHNITSLELTQTLLDEIQRTDSKLKAYVTINPSVEEDAKTADLELKSGRPRGPLHGIPITIKDNFETAGIRTTCGSKLLKDYVPNADATAVARLKEAGALVLGKANTHEFALGVITPPTRNPWNLNCVPGGSSGGSAAAVAAGSAIAATGSDTMGSIRIPSSFCGTVGLKPTYGRVSRVGVFPESWSLDHVGPIVRRVEDAAILLSIIAGYDGKDPNSIHVSAPNFLGELCRDVKGLRVGIPSNYFFQRCEPEIVKTVRSAIDVLVSLGCELVDFEFPRIPEITAACFAIDLSESSAYHESSLRDRPEDFAPDVRDYLEQGLFVPATYYINALRTREVLIDEIVRRFNDFDAIVTPTEPILAPEVGRTRVELGGVDEDVVDAIVRFTGPFNLLGLPAISVPCGFSNGLPIGMQLASTLFDESTILRLGYAYEQATSWHTRFPRVD